MASSISLVAKRHQDLSPDETRRIAGWTEDLFGEEEAKYEWADQHWHVLAFHDGVFVSHAALTERVARAGGVRVKVAGIGGVMTPEAWQGRGLGRAVMDRAAALMREVLDVDFGLLLCSEDLVAFYASLGWERMEGSLTFAQSSGPVCWEEEVMVLDLGRQAWPGGSIDLCGPPW